MQYNTIRQYQEGGAIRRALAQAFFGRGVTKAQEELEEEAKKAEKEGKRRGLLGALGSFAGSYALPALATAVLGPVGLVGGALIKGAGAGLGRGLGETLGGLGAEDVSVGSTGFLGKDFKTLKEYQESLGEGIGGRALGKAGATALTDFVLSGGFKALSDIKKSRQVADPALKQTMGFDIEAPELGLQRSLGEKDFLTSGPLTGNQPSLSDSIPSSLSTESSKDILSKAGIGSTVRSPTELAYQESLDRANQLGDKNLYEYSRQMSLPPSADAEMLGGVEVPSFMGDMIGSGELDTQGLPDVSGLPSKTEIDYLNSLRKATETGSLNRALDMSQTAQSQAMQTSNQMQNLINYLTPKPTVADFLQMRQRAIGNYAGGGLFNPMKTGRRVF